MDAVISIGNQSLLDGVLRLIGPALQALRGPLPVPLPGLTNSLLTIRNLTPVLPPDTAGRIQLRVDFDLSGEALLVASVAAGNLNLNLGVGTINLNPAAGTVDQPLRNGTLAVNAATGTVGPAQLAINPTTGTLQIPAGAPAPLSLGAIVGTLTLPQGVGNLGLPLPAVVPVPVDLSPGQLLSATILFALTANGAVVGTETPISAKTSFGIQFGFNPTAVTLDALPGGFAANLSNALTAALKPVVAQLLGGVNLVQPPLNLATVANDIAAEIPKILESTLSDAFSGLIGRTGRLVFPQPGNGASCDVAALPTAAKALLSIGPGGSLMLQVGFSRGVIAHNDPFPPFAPSTALDVNVTISNEFLRDLICCLLEKMPNLALLPAGRTVAGNCCTWPDIRVNLGLMVLAGSLTLCVEAQPDGTKVITLRFDLGAKVTADIWHLGWLEILLAHLGFKLRAAVNLNDVTRLTALRLRDAVDDQDDFHWEFDLGPALITFLILAAGSAFMTGLLGAAIAVLAFAVVVIVRQVLRNAVELILSTARVLESPAAIPSGVFEAFGSLVPVSIDIDDLQSNGVLNTPTSPWSLLPLSRKVLGRNVVPPTPVNPRTIVPHDEPRSGKESSREGRKPPSPRTPPQDPAVS